MIRRNVKRIKKRRKRGKVTVKVGLDVSQDVSRTKMEGAMQKWIRKAAAVIAVICLAFGTAGVAMHKWDEIRQAKAHEELTAQVVGMSEAGTTGETGFPESGRRCMDSDSGNTDQLSGGSGEGQ